MKILHLSDLHLEFGSMDVPKTDADIAVLSGDIHAGSRGIDWASQFDIPVIYILGNHEFYGFTQFDELIQECRDKAKRYPNIHFLENESVLIDGVRFHGATFWTDFKLENNLSATWSNCSGGNTSRKKGVITTSTCSNSKLSAPES